MLYEAMAAVDPTTGLSRGFLRLAADTRPDSVLFTLDIRSDGWWRDAERFITQQAPLVLQVGWQCRQGAGWGGSRAAGSIVVAGNSWDAGCVHLLVTQSAHSMAAWQVAGFCSMLAPVCHDAPVEP